MQTEIKKDGAMRSSGISRALGWLETVLAGFACLSLALIMLVVAASVVTRYVLQSPLAWSYDLIGSYLMVCVFFFALSDTLHHHGHIAIDIFAHALPRRFEHLSMLVGYAIAAVLMALVAWQGWVRFEAAYTGNNLISITVPWPTWPAYLMVLVGSVMMALRCLIRALGHGASSVTGRELADMPPPPKRAASDGEHSE